MATKKSPDLSALGLLGEALDDYKRGHESPFVAKMVLSFMDQVLDEDPSAVALNSGQSILVEAFQSSEQFGLAWWQKRGRQAWAPTPDTPQPLIGIIDKGTREWGSNNRYRKISRETFGAKGAGEFFRDGLELAMPLRQEIVEQWDPAKALNSQQKALVEQQKFLVGYCFSEVGYDDLSSKRKIAELLKAGGAVPSTGMMEKDYYTFIVASPKHLHAKIMHPGSFGGKNQDETPAIEPWWKDWMRSRNYDSAHEVIRAMKKEKMSGALVKDCEEHLFVQDVMRQVEKSQKESPGSAWRLVSAVVDGRKDGWTVGNDTGLAWQQALAIRPQMLTHALADPRVDFTLISADGRGIWDHMARAVLDGKAQASLKRLARKVEPRLMATSTPLFWRWWSSDETACQGFLEATAQQHPIFWLGNKKQQWNGVLNLIERWICDDPKERSSHSICLNALFGTSVNRASLSPELILAMRVVQIIARDDRRVGHCIPNAVSNPVEEITADPRRIKQMSAKILSRKTQTRIRPHIEAALMAVGTTQATARRQIRL